LSLSRVSVGVNLVPATAIRETKYSCKKIGLAGGIRPPKKHMTDRQVLEQRMDPLSATLGSLRIQEAINPRLEAMAAWVSATPVMHVRAAHSDGRLARRFLGIRWLDVWKFREFFLDFLGQMFRGNYVFPTQAFCSGHVFVEKDSIRSVC
jgi:hypothetical protein